jgi:hypothetical protein
MVFLKFMSIAAVPAAFAATVFAQSNIDNSVPNKYGWGENVGWTNWRDANSAVQGVNVGGFVMSGYIWGENIGWIQVGDGTPTTPPYYANADDTDYGVNIDADGDLHGYAWSENTGWIYFDGGAMATPAQPARVICASPPGQLLARLTGYAWGENIGWINLSDLTDGKFVSVDAATTPLLCDVNHDGLKDGRDVQNFTWYLLLTLSPGWRDVCSGDVEGSPDRGIDFDDVGPFVDCLLQ